jgi:hypothetical protein
VSAHLIRPHRNLLPILRIKMPNNVQQNDNIIDEILLRYIPEKDNSKINRPINRTEIIELTEIADLVDTIEITNETHLL